MNIFLTGGTGFVGKKFIKLAIKQGHKIFAISRKKKINKKNIKWLIGELDKPWPNYFKKTDVLVHLAAAGVDKNANSQEIINTNVLKSSKLVMNAIQSGCKKFLIISSSSEYKRQLSKEFIELSLKSKRDPEDIYGKSKVIFSDFCKMIAKKKKVQVRLMRLFPVYGEGEKKNRLYPSLKKAALEGKKFIIMNPHETRDFTNVNYVSRVILDALNFKKRRFKYFQIFHISQKHTTTIKDFALIYWKKFEAKGSIFFKDNKNNSFLHISDNASLWKIK
jgi:nucleoside-diphosphate-sugar epimerase